MPIAIPRATRRTFLSWLAETGSVLRACERAGVGRSSVYRWRAADPDFAADWAAAEAEAADRLEDEAMRRAMEGVAVPVFYKGEQVGERRQYSDRLLILLLKARRPERYGRPAGAACPRCDARRAAAPAAVDGAADRAAEHAGANPHPHVAAAAVEAPVPAAAAAVRAPAVTATLPRLAARPSRLPYAPPPFAGTRPHAGAGPIAPTLPFAAPSPQHGPLRPVPPVPDTAIARALTAAA